VQHQPMSDQRRIGLLIHTPPVNQIATITYLTLSPR